MTNDTARLRLLIAQHQLFLARQQLAREEHAGVFSASTIDLVTRAQQQYQQALRQVRSESREEANING